MRFSPSEKRILKLMIVDCDVHHMNERESRLYINKRFGRIISRRTYYNYKNKVYSGVVELMKEKGKKITKGVTFRIPSNTLSELTEESNKKQVSLNILVNQIFNDYIDWHRYASDGRTIILPRSSVSRIILISHSFPYCYFNADAMNMNAKYITIPTTPHLNHNLADLSRSSIQCLIEFPNGNRTIALTPNMKFNPYNFCSRDTDKLNIKKISKPPIIVAFACSISLSSINFIRSLDLLRSILLYMAKYDIIGRSIFSVRSQIPQSLQ